MEFDRLIFFMTKLIAILSLVLLTIVGCTNSHSEKAIQSTSSNVANDSWAAQKAKINAQLKASSSTEDSLKILLQFISSHGDGGLEGHIEQTIWQTKTIAEKYRLCEHDSAKLLCGGLCSYLVDAIYEFTPWHAFAYWHGSENPDLSHITTIVNIRGKLMHVDPLFGYLVYDAQTDTLLDFTNEIKLLKAGKHQAIGYKAVDFQTDVLVCEDSASITQFATQFYMLIGPDEWKEQQTLIYPSNGICPYKLKSELTLQRWLSLDKGGAPYVKWLNGNGHPTIAYLALYPLNYQAYATKESEALASTTYANIKALTAK